MPIKNIPKSSSPNPAKKQKQIINHLQSHGSISDTEVKAMGISPSYLRQTIKKLQAKGQNIQTTSKQTAPRSTFYTGPNRSIRTYTLIQ